MEKKIKVAVLTGDDRTWALDAWARTLPWMAEKYELTGIWVFPEKLKGNTGAGIPLWYLKTFGLSSFLIFGFYALKRKATKRISSWEALARRHSSALYRARTPNAPEVSAWVREKAVDVLFVSVNDILQKVILNAPRSGLINRHSSLLPSCRGVFPYFWAKGQGLPSGVTFHCVQEDVDSGPILCQMRHPASQQNISMLRFYMDTHHIFPEMALLALERLTRACFKERSPLLSDSYFSFPTARDAKIFRQKGGKIAEWSDLCYEPSLRFEENFS